MNTKLVNTAAGVILAALTQNRTAAGIALALDSAQLLLTSETAAELKQLQERVAELEAQRERRRVRLVALQNDALNMRGTLAPNGEDNKVPFELGETLTPAVEWLINRVAELEAAASTMYRAEYNSIVLGYYRTREAAREHCVALARRETPKATLEWRTDEPSEADSPEALWDVVPRTARLALDTGYVVTPLEVPAAYDPDADE